MSAPLLLPVVSLVKQLAVAEGGGEVGRVVAEEETVGGVAGVEHSP